METQDLMKVWKDYHDNLDGQLRVNGALLKDASIRTVKSHLAEFKGTSIFELVANSLFSIYLMQFIAGHIFEVKFLVPAILLLLLMVGGIIWNVYKLTELKKLTFATPVIQMQKSLERLRLYERKEINLLYILIPIVSLPFLIVGLKSLIGLDLFVFPTSWMVSYTVGSFVVALGVVWFLKKFPDRKMDKAIDFLREISMFEEN